MSQNPPTSGMAGPASGPPAGKKPLPPRARLRRSRGLGQQDRLDMPRAVIWSVVAVVLLALAWMAWAEIDRVVRAGGRLVPSQRAQMVQHLEGGIVSGIRVREGQIVERGAELILISDVQAQSLLGERTVRVNALRAQVARLKAEAEGTAVREAAPGGPGADADAERERLVAAARRERMERTVQVLREQLDQRQQEIREAQARREGLSKESAIAAQQLALVKDMMARQAASRLELLEAQGRAERFDTQIREIDASIPKSRAAIRELESRIAEATAQFRSEARTKLAEAQVELSRLEEEISAGQDRLTRTAVRAPSRGVVNRVFTTTLGGVVRPGDPVVEITPLDDDITLEAMILPQERAEVVPGLPAVVRVSAYDYAIYGTLQGQVQEVSADTLADERGNRFYRVRVAVPADTVRRFGQDLTPGMTATADIVLGQRTVLQYVISPMTRFLSGELQDRK